MPLALTLPQTEWRSPLLCVCHAVVMFTIVAQGLTMERFATWLHGEARG